MGPCSANRWSASLIVPGTEPMELFFERLDDAIPGDPTLEPFLVASLLFWMRSPSHKLRIEGEVSRTLLTNLDELQMVWHRWLPARYSPVLIEPEVVSSAPRVDQGAITAFSGGVDSTFTVFRHSATQTGRRMIDLKEAVFVSGFDIPFDDLATTTAAYERSREVLESAGVRAARLRTNFRQLPQRWTDASGLAVSSALLILQQTRSVGLVPSTEPYDQMVYPWGSTPIQDWMASTDLMEIRHDGAGFGRIEKIAALSNWEPALHNLRVCWEGEDLGRNCGRCEKCIRTILCFWVIGKPTPPCFDRSPDVDEISGIKIRSALALSEIALILNAAKENGFAQERWAVALHRRARRARVRGVLSSMKRMYTQSRRDGSLKR